MLSPIHRGVGQRTVRVLSPLIAEPACPLYAAAETRLHETLQQHPAPMSEESHRDIQTSIDQVRHQEEKA